MGAAMKGVVAEDFVTEGGSQKLLYMEVLRGPWY